jgi:hypothetical protein
MSEDFVPYLLSAIELLDPSEVLLPLELVVPIHPCAEESCDVSISMHSLSYLFLLPLDLVGGQQIMPIHKYLDLHIISARRLKELLNLPTVAVLESECFECSVNT